ncbi:MAG: hypothetical protein EKK55_14750 [Rhodocyclaceae bacterium]|nr:MAG: hypothetical protein EKK55_14750 [Rhodocyclaceae bacterium]
MLRIGSELDAGRRPRHADALAQTLGFNNLTPLLQDSGVETLLRVPPPRGGARDSFTLRVATRAAMLGWSQARMMEATLAGAAGVACTTITRRLAAMPASTDEDDDEGTCETRAQAIARAGRDADAIVADLTLALGLRHADSLAPWSGPGWSDIADTEPPPSPAELRHGSYGWGGGVVAIAAALADAGYYERVSTLPAALAAAAEDAGVDAPALTREIWSRLTRRGGEWGRIKRVADHLGLPVSRFFSGCQVVRANT